MRGVGSVGSEGGEVLPEIQAAAELADRLLVTASSPAMPATYTQVSAPSRRARRRARDRQPPSRRSYSARGSLMAKMISGTTGGAKGGVWNAA